MTTLVRCIIFSLFIALCVGQFGTQVQKVCLYSKGSSTVLAPLKLVNGNCNGNNSFCMNKVYNYNNFQYNGPAALKPVKGEVVMFLTQDQQNRFDYVCLLNANVTTTMNVSMDITGCEPTNLLLKDDPEKDGDSWGWNKTTNSGKFRWVTQPGYTDGVIIGHLSFIDGYCVKTVFNQPNKAISQISVMTGNITHAQKVLTVPYVPGSTFEFCQYPLTASYHSDASCPNAKDGTASIDVIFGPPSVSYKWTNSTGSVIGTTRNISGLAVGDYQVEVNDLSNSGCQAIKVITVGAPTLGIPIVSTIPFGCSILASASVTPVGGKGPFTYEFVGRSINVSGSSPSILNLLMGNYTVTVTDSCGSTAQASFTIGTIGCCGDEICQTNEACGSTGSCPADCGECCVPGTYKSGSSCTVCPPGTRSTTYNAASCTDCAANTFNAGGADECVDCPANTYSAQGSGKCVDCAYGSVRASGEASCHPCGSGLYAAPCGDGCKQAPAGHEASEDWAAVRCPPGTYAAAGSDACSPCSTGYYSASGATSCTQCPAGKTTSGTGATHVLSCF